MSWKKVKLGEICTITKGETGIMKAIDGDYTMVTLGEENKTHNDFQFDTKAVIIQLVSSTGHGHASMKRVKYCEGKFALGTILCAVIPKDENFVLAKYLHIYLHKNRERLLVSIMRGAANVSLPIKRIYDVEVLIPDLETQKRIIKNFQVIEEKANALSTETKTQTALLSSLKQAILQDAIQGKLTEGWRNENILAKADDAIYFPSDKSDGNSKPDGNSKSDGNSEYLNRNVALAHSQNTRSENGEQLLQRIKAEKLNRHGVLTRAQKEKPLPPITKDEIPFELPEGWVWCRLGEITNYGSSKKAEPKNLNSDTWVLDLEDIEKESSRNIQEIHLANRNSSSTKSIFKKGDVLYSKLRPYLDKVIVAHKDGVCTTEILPLEMFCNVNSYYFMYALKRKDFLNYVATKVGGMKMPRLGTEEGRNAIFPLPPLAEQQAIVEKVEVLLAKCDALSEEIEILGKHGNTLLKAMFNETFETKQAITA